MDKKRVLTISAHFVLQAAVGGSEVFPCVGATVRSSHEVLYHQAHVNERETVTYGKRSLLTHTHTHTHTHTQIQIQIHIYYINVL